MESVAAEAAGSKSRVLPSIDFETISVWALVCGLVLYLAFRGGGYDIVVHSQVGIVVWWLVLLGALWGLLRVTRLTRLAWAVLALFGGFVAWTALGLTWSISPERSLQDLSLIVGYLGALVLGIGLHQDRDRAVRQTVAALGTAIAIVALMAVVSRLRPDLFASADQTASFLRGTSSRLDWPLNYWNALAALMAMGLPLLLALATSVRSLAAGAMAAAALPILALCAYLTFSRGGALACVVAMLVFIGFASDRIAKLATALLGALGAAVLIAAAVHRSAIEHGLTNGTARSEGNSMLIAVVLVCVGVAVTHVGVTLAVRHGTRPSWLVFSRSQARGLLAGGVALVAIAAVLVVASGKASQEWQQFKHSRDRQLQTDSISRFGIASGNGRYDYWKAALQATSAHPLNGSGPGTFQLLWLPRAPYYSYVENAHSLYFETLAELGVVGLALLAGFLATVVAAALRLISRTRDEAQTRAAGVAAAMVSFLVSAGVDWVWQVPVLPVAFMFLAAAVLAPSLSRRSKASARPLLGWMIRGGLVALAVACLLAIGIPLATTNGVRSSQAAASAHEYTAALADAPAAARVEPGAASPEVQIALVLEAEGNARGALAAAQRAVDNEPGNWSTWLIVSRLDAETGRSAGSLAAYRQARALNPRSPVFRR